MTECDLYDLILSVISPTLLWVLSLLVAVGWALRMKLHISYTTPMVAKFTAMLVFGLLAYFYLAIDYADWPTEHYSALSRVVFLLLLAHEVMYHLFVAWVHRRLNGKASVD